ncbi:PilW family protein [Methylotenera sp.]|uniref:PilW family protein n=1 Tax=Methylotenera sp. TaxID=2051956 RepID=UPI00248763B9|nr:PilW family protein [Methylotenera sp.]MDI1360750.1 PilW family protein [Methylotenera sp.]
MKNIFNTYLVKPQSSKQRGFSLIELMVGLIIGLLMSLVVYNVLNVNEGRKRTTTSLNDINQAGSYAIYQLDKQIRSAGSGFTGGGDQIGANFTYGCRLDMALSGSQLTPAASFPAPFNAVNGVVRVAPVIIFDGAAGAGGDVIVTMAGTAGLGELPSAFSSPATAATLQLVNQAGMRANDVLLLADHTATNISPCLMQQVASTFTPVANGSAVPLLGAYNSASVNGTSATSFTATAQAVNLGQAPNLNMFAVAANGSNFNLMKYDLMQPVNAGSAAPNPAIYVDGVYQIHALYGVDTNPTTSTLTWVAPTGAFSAVNLLNGSLAANAALQRIRAIKIGVVMRTSLLEREAVSGGPAHAVSNTTLTLFSDSVPVTVNLNPTTYRYRAFEAAVPLRNTLVLSGALGN